MKTGIPAVDDNDPYSKRTKPKLGQSVTIAIGSSNLERSSRYYTALGFREIMRSDYPFPRILLSDGSLLIMLKAGEVPYCSLTYFTSEIDKALALLEEYGVEIVEKPKGHLDFQRHQFRSPSGLNVSLISLPKALHPPTVLPRLNMSEDDYLNAEKYINKVCGLYGEFAQPVDDLVASIIFWSNLGFSVISKFTAPYPWCIISDGLSVLGLHQTKSFHQPTITYFAVDMRDKIEALKKGKLREFGEIAGESNTVLKTPDHQHINLFTIGKFE